VFTVMRTISEPARASCATCSAVACAFSVVRVRHRLHEDGRVAADDLVGHADGT
jgi:hypothetical protein